MQLTLVMSLGLIFNNFTWHYNFRFFLFLWINFFQIAVVLRTPPFYNQDIVEPVLVNVYLYSPVHNERSEPKSFHYVPENPGIFW